jgi:predicted metalloendopeptidase
MGIVERRELKNVHHKMTLAKFVKLAPSFDWTAYLAALGAPPFASLDVSDPGFFKGLEASLKSLPLEDWKSYLRWTFIMTADDAANYGNLAALIGHELTHGFDEGRHYDAHGNLKD